MLAFLAALIGATSVLASDEALVLSHASTEKEMFQAIRSIEAWGGKVLLAYPPHVLICQVPRPVKDHIASEELVESVHYGPLDPDVVEGYGKLALWGVEYWNSRFERPKLAPSEELPPLADDVVFERVSFPLRKPVVEREYPEGPEHTSAYMVGSTVVSVILLESNGAIDPSTEDWDEERISEVRKEVGEALEWWARNAPDDADVWFAIDTVMVRETSYEPINHAMRDDEDIRNAILNEVLMRLGYSREKDHYANLVDYANDLRGESYEWAFVIFVVNSFNDSDGSFADLHYAFAYLQGPLVMLTYDNGGWGIENMGGILAHEIGHVFGALDETSFMLRSLPTSGFLQVENGNVSNEVNHMPCIMKYPLESYPKGQICYFTKGQIGWRDKDDDNILDCVDSSFNPGPDLDGNGIIDHWDNLFAVGPRSVKVLVGSSRRFCAIGGRPPYTWSSSDTSVGSISTHGEFKAKGPGTTIVTVTDSEGRMARDPVVVTVVDIANTPPDVPSLVTPLDNSSGQDTSLVLVWAGSDPDGDAITYDVYFGETAQLDSTNLVLRDYFWTDCSVEGLEPGTTYYWKVMASDGQSHISSPIWKFQTRFRYNLHLAGYFIDDATGDKDGRLDSGETVRLAVKLENLGQDVSDLWAVLSSDDPSVDVLSDSSYIEHISSNDIFTLTSPFRVKLKPSASGPITFTLKITSVGQTVSVDSFAIPVNFEPARLEIKTIGPYGGTISDLVIDPFNSDVLYAATPAGVFKTMDGGETWFPIISELAGPQNIAINPLNPNILFAGGNKLHKSVDGGEHWEVLETEFRYISCIAISPFNPSVIYVGAEGGLFRSTDGGETWQSIGNGLDTNIIHKIAFDSAYPEVMYLITITGHLYKSVNGGLDWTLLKETPVSAVAVNPSNNRIIYIGGVNGIMRSCDGGETWENTAPYLYTTSFAFDPEDPMVLYAGTSKGVYKSVDGGENWLPVGGQGLPEPEPQWRSVGYGSSIVLVDPRNPATLYYATQFDGIFKSIDYGHNWQPEDYGITATFVRGFEFDHEDSRVIYAATDVGVYRSEDGGDTWLYMKSLGRRRVRSLAMDSKGNLYVACDDWSFKGGVFAARDGGLHWSMLLDVPSIDITLGESGVIYVVTLEGKILRSLDEGASWHDFSKGLSEGLDKIVIDPNDPSALFGITEKSLYRTSGDSTNWRRVTGKGLETIGKFSDLQIAPDGRMYLAKEGFGGHGIYRSIDGGDTWIKVNDSCSGVIAIDPTNPEVIYAIGGGALLQSIDAGLSWEEVLPLRKIAWLATSLRITPDGNVLYIGTAGRGARRIDIKSPSITAVREADNFPDKFSLGHNYPNPFNPITQIPYQLPCKSKVEICIYNLLGQKVRTLVDEVQKAGYHKVIWDGRDEFGREVASGVYLCRMEAAPKSEGRSFVRTIKMLLLR